MTNSPEARGGALLALCAALSAAPAVADPGGLAELLAGEFNNHEQVWQQGLDGVVPHPRRHWRFQRLGDGRMELSVGLGQTAPAVPGWTLALQAEAEGIRAEVVAAGGAAECRYRWRERDGGYVGHALGDGCPELPVSFAVDGEGLSTTWATDDGERVERARRARHYTGWVALRRGHVEPDAAPDDYVFVRGARWHDEGFVLPLLDGDRPTGYAVELARLTYQNTRTAVLKLGIVEEATGETLSYAWAAPGARRIGINLRWIQTGLTRADDGAEAPAAAASPTDRSP